MKFIRQKDAAGRMPERGKRKGSLRGIPGLALVLALGAVLAAGGMGTRTYAWGTLEAPGIEDNGEFVTFPSTSGKENGTETEKGNDWTSGLEGGTTVVILSDGEPLPNSEGDEENESGGESESDPKEKGNMKGLLTGVTITDDKGQEVEKGGTLYVGEKYKITLTFSEGGVQSQKQFAWNDDGTMTYQLPANFKVEPKRNIPLTIEVNGKPVEIGTYSVTEDGQLVVQLDENGKTALKSTTDAALNFEMDATVETAEGSDDGHIKFDDAGEDFDFEVVDQARVEVDKQGKYTENADKQGGKLEYTVTTTVERGSVSGLTILDELTPPNTSALNVEDVNTEDIKVTLKKPDGTVVELTRDVDYELVEVPDTERPGKKTFQVKLKEESRYGTLNEGDVLEVTYPYEVEYVHGSTDVFWGNVANDVNVTGKGKVPAPADDPEKAMPEIDIDEHRGSNVEIIVTPPGDGIIFKTQEFSEADHKLHYTLYTVVPAGNWTPFFIQDDMVVEFGGEKYYLPEFKEGGRVSNLQVSTVAVEKDKLGGWSTSDGEQRRQTLEELKKGATKLEDGFKFEAFPDEPTEDKSRLPVGYDPESMDQWVYWYRNEKTLDIIFGFYGGKWGPNGIYDSKWGHWNITDHDTLIITEYDLDMSDDAGTIILQKMSDSSETLEKKASEVLLAGIRNNVNMRFSGYYPGYSVFFNNSERMNKSGTPIKSDNTIEYTVTMNTTDTTVNKYFRDVNQDMWAAVHKTNSWNEKTYYPETMQAVFYDVLPDGWEYVEGSLTATAYNNYKETYYPFKGNAYQQSPVVKEVDGKKVISAPLVFFYNDNGAIENGGNRELFNTFSENLVSLTFTYKLKATDQWIRDHATDTNSVTVHNHAEIRDNIKPQAHWEADANVPYLPQHLSKTAEQVEDGGNLLRFTLHVNPGSVILDSGKGYLVVTDKSDNLEIQKGTIKVTDTAEKELTQVPYEEGMTLKDNEWALMPETESGQFKLMVPDGKALLVTYDARIPVLGEGISVSNTAGIEGVVNSDSGFERIFNVDHIVAGGSGSTYVLDFQKVDSTNDTKGLSGAKFKFYIVVDDTEDESGDDSDGSEDNSGDKLTVNATLKVGEREYRCYSGDDWEFTTNDNGVYQIPSNWRLAPGNYYILVETEAPEGYELTEPVLFYFGVESQVDRENYPNARAVPGSTLTVDDPPFQYTLPETGGSGTVFYVVTGLALILGGGIVLTAQKRRRQVQ